MRLIDKLSCKFGNHRYTWETTNDVLVTGDVCRVEVKCVNCGRQDCFLTTYRALDRYAECLHDEMMGEGVARA